MKHVLNIRTISLLIFFTALSGEALTQNVIRGPYLQIGTSTSVVVKWRTDQATDSQVRYGSAPGKLNLSAEINQTSTEHEVELTGLSPDTKYYYAVGSTSQILAGDDASYFFVTSPPPNTPKPTRIWILGDSGTKNDNARAVRDAYYNYTGNRHTDLWIMLGDNAYNNGTDEEYQLAVFENMYEAMLRKSVLWATRGNHDRGPKVHGSWTNGDDYYRIFTFPTNGEAGGIASGTEAYYSFDYGNIHFICLESTSGKMRQSSSPMWTWLEEDLAANDKDWNIAFWHHPPYSKGSHNSDSESELVDMRERAVTRLEEAGVDLVMSGHSHSYERSYLIDGHYGKSSMLTDEMKLDSGSGREDVDGAYVKATLGPAGHEGAVYIVAGSSGKTSGGSLNHPAMFYSLDELGSVILDIAGNVLDAKFIDDKGEIRDYFTIKKGNNQTGPATQLVMISGNNQTALVNATLPLPFEVQVRDDQNNPVSGVAVTFEITSGSGALSNSQPQITSDHGRASTVLTLGSEAGTVTVAASANGLTGSPQIFTAHANAGPQDTDPPAAPTNVRIVVGGD